MNTYQINVDLSQQFQSIEGFGASGAWSLDRVGSEWTEENKNKLADLLFSNERGIGLSMWRFNIGAGSIETDQEIIKDPWRRAECFKSGKDQAYDWSKQQGQQWFLRAARARGVERFIAFVNSPPVWMTKNGHGQPDQFVGSTNLRAECITDFAEFLADVLEHFQQMNLPFQYISPINEPTWSWDLANQEGNRYNNTDIKAVLKALNDERVKRRLDVEIDAAEAVEYLALLDDDLYAKFIKNDSTYRGGNSGGSNGEYRQYIKTLLGDPEMREIIGNKVSAHAYWSDHFAGDERLVQLRRYVQENLKRYHSDAKLWMSEYCVLNENGPGRDLSMETALSIARLIHFDLVETEVTSWQWWLALSPYDYKDGLIYTDYLNNGDQQTIITSKTLWALGNYSRFIRPGSVRINLQGADNKDRLMGSAYYNKDENQLSIVFINYSYDDEKVKMVLNNLSKRIDLLTLKAYVTSETQDLSELEIKDAQSVVDIPARSVVTLVYC